MTRDRRGMTRSQAEALVGTVLVVVLAAVCVGCVVAAISASGGLW